MTSWQPIPCREPVPVGDRRFSFPQDAGYNALGQPGFDPGGRHQNESDPAKQVRQPTRFREPLPVHDSEIGGKQP